MFLGQRGVLTAQIYFPDALNEFIYENVAAYRRPQPRDTLNRTDFIARAAGNGAFAGIREESGRYLAALVVGVDPAATAASGDRPPLGGPAGPPPGPPGESAGRPPGGPPPGGPPGPGGASLTGEPRLRALIPGAD